MCEIPCQNPLEQLIYSLKDEGQEDKTGPILGYVPAKVGGQTERVKKDEYV
jgi:hypothetical protein